MSTFQQFNIDNSPYKSNREQLTLDKISSLVNKSQNSITTKPVSFNLPGLHLTDEEVKKENDTFLEFLKETEEQRKYIPGSELEDMGIKAKSSYLDDKEKYIERQMGSNPSATSKLLDSWKINREDSPLLSVALLSDSVEFFQPKSAANSFSSVYNMNFRAASLWGKLFDKEAAGPQFTEALGRNAQANVIAAIRARGGIKGELWANAVAKSTYLRNMLTDTAETDQKLESWIRGSPSLINLKGSVPFSAYAGDTVLDILADSEKPESWDPKRAIEELQIAEPGLHNLLFNEMQLKPEDVENAANTPLQFKYFIADAIDQYAFGVTINEYQKQAGGLEYFFGAQALPLVVNSFNSNDQLAEIGVTAALTFFTGGTYGAIGGTALLTKRLAKSSSLIRKALKTANAFERFESISARVAQVNRYLWKAQKILPSNITETILHSMPATRGIFMEAKAGTSLFKKTVQKSTALFIGEAAQGIVESGVQQYEAMSNGFQEHFSASAIVQNAVEEGIGGLVLGGPIRLIGKVGERVSTTNMGKYVNRQINKGKVGLLGSLPELKPSVARDIDLATRVIMGIPDGVSFEDFKGALSTQARLNILMDKIDNLGLGDLLSVSSEKANRNENPFIAEAISIMSGGDKKQEFRVRVDMAQRLSALMDHTTNEETGVSTLSRDDVEAVFYLAAMDSIDPSSRSSSSQTNRLLETLLESDQAKKGKTIVTQHSGGEFTHTSNFYQVTDQDLIDLGNKIQAQTQGLVTKLGADSVSEISDIFGKSIGQEQIDLTNDVLDEAEAALGTNNRGVGVSFLGLPLLGMFRSKLSPKKVDTSTGTPPPEADIDAEDEIKSDAADAADADREEAAAAREEAVAAREEAAAAPEAAPAAPKTNAEKAADDLKKLGDIGVGAAKQFKNDTAKRLSKVLDGSMTFDEFLIDAGIKPNGQSGQDARKVYDLAKLKGLTSIDGDTYTALLEEANQAAAAPKVATAAPTLSVKVSDKIKEKANEMGISELQLEKAAELASSIADNDWLGLHLVQDETQDEANKRAQTHIAIKDKFEHISNIDIRTNGHKGLRGVIDSRVSTKSLEQALTELDKIPEDERHQLDVRFVVLGLAGKEVTIGLEVEGYSLELIQTELAKRKAAAAAPTAPEAAPAAPEAAPAAPEAAAALKAAPAAPEAATAPKAAPAAPEAADKSVVEISKDLVTAFDKDLDSVTDVELTPEEAADLLGRVCYRKGK
jgi:hypothetical protein